MTTVKTSSSLLDIALFVGYEIDSALKEELKKCNPHLLQLFTKGPDYVSQVTYNGKNYLGKLASDPISVQELEALELHVMSILKRLAPHFSFAGKCVMFGI